MFCVKITFVLEFFFPKFLTIIKKDFCYKLYKLLPYLFIGKHFYEKFCKISVLLNLQNHLNCIPFLSFDYSISLTCYEDANLK